MLQISLCNLHYSKYLSGKIKDLSSLSQYDFMHQAYFRAIEIVRNSREQLIQIREFVDYRIYVSKFTSILRLFCLQSQLLNLDGEPDVYSLP